MPSRFLRVRTAAVAGLAALSIGGVAAAATGLASAPAERSARAASSRPSGGQLARAHGAAAAKAHDANAAAAATRSSASPKPRGHARGPDASGPARHGLCRAWSAGQGDDHGRRTDAPAFQALVAAAGGADRVPAYCQAELDASAPHGRRPATPPGGAPVEQSPPTGPPERPGQGHGQGGPPTTS